MERLRNLQVAELNKYLDKHHMQNIKHRKKTEKVLAIRRHILQEDVFGNDNGEDGDTDVEDMESENTHSSDDTEAGASSDENGDENKNVEATSPSESNENSDSEDNDEVVGIFGSDTDDDNQIQVVVTRGGRRAGSWKNAYNRY